MIAYEAAPTQRQKDLLDFIVQHVAENGSQPSYAEMMQHMWVSSPNSIQGMLKSLERKGFIQRTGKARAMKLLRREH